MHIVLYKNKVCLQQIRCALHREGGEVDGNDGVRMRMYDQVAKRVNEGYGD